MRTSAGADDGRYVLRRARFGGVRSSVFGINGEGKSLETVTKPLTSVVATGHVDHRELHPAARSTTVVRPMLESGDLNYSSEPWRSRTRRFVFRATTSPTF